MSTATHQQPDYTTQTDSTAYMAAIDAAAKVVSELGAAFAVHESATPGLSVVVDGGAQFTGTVVVEQAPQTLSGIAAPTTNPRRDLIELDPLTATAYRIQGSEAASPTTPTVTTGRVPLAYYQISPGATAVTNSMIVPIRFSPWAALMRQGMQSMSGDLAVAGAMPAWGSNFKVMSLGGESSLALNTANGSLHLVTNAYWDGAVWRYAANGPAADIWLSPSGAEGFLVQTAGNGTAGAVVPFSTKFSVDPSYFLSNQKILVSDNVSSGIPVDPYITNHIEARTGDGSPAIIALHRGGFSHVALIHDATDVLKIHRSAGIFTNWDSGNLSAGTRGFIGYGTNLNTLPDVTFTDLACDIETSDADAMHTGSNPYVVIPSGVTLVSIYAEVLFSNAPVGSYFTVRAVKNGVVAGLPITPFKYQYISAGATMVQFHEGPLAVVAGDQIKIQGLQSSGGSNTATLTRFNVRIIK